jgi:hypothetical protein
MEGVPPPPAGGFFPQLPGGKDEKTKEHTPKQGETPHPQEGQGFDQTHHQLG